MKNQENQLVDVPKEERAEQLRSMAKHTKTELVITILEMDRTGTNN